MREPGSAAGRFFAIVTIVGSVSALVGCATTHTPAKEGAGYQSAPTPSDTPYAFDDVPGLGISEQASIRDETIAFWEAWKRDTIVAECMEKAGFKWHPEALYPNAVIVQIATQLGVLPSAHSTELMPETLNALTEASLNGPLREAYFRAYYGESVADIEYWKSTEGDLPPGASFDGFANHGCRTEGTARIGSIWNLKRTLAGDLAALESDARETEAFAGAVKVYVECLEPAGVDGVAHPADLERLAVESGDPLYVQADIQCNQLWTAANRVGVAELADAFLLAHRDEIDLQLEHYSGLLDDIRRDDAFLKYLESAAARALALP